MSTDSVEKIIRTALAVLILAVPLIVFFLWESKLSTDLPINDGKFGTFGDFFGGVFGSIWSLCGVLVFYAALKEQRKDFLTNSHALTRQTEALQLQIKEFRLQREELQQTRDVFIEQARTLKQQRMSATYFSLLDLYRKIVEDLNKQCTEGSYFRTFKAELSDGFAWSSDAEACHQLAKNRYVEIFYKKREELSHYFKLVYRIFKIVEDSDLDEKEKFYYITIFRSQLTENEMLALYYNSHSPYGDKTYTYFLRYNFLKHLPNLAKPEFLGHLSHISHPTKLLAFNSAIFLSISSFLSSLRKNIREDNFTEEKVSHLIDENIVISLRSSELNELNVEFAWITNEIQIAGLAQAHFQNYMRSYFFDIFVASRYQEETNIDDFIRTDIDYLLKKAIFTLKSNHNFRLNVDTDDL